MPLRSKVISALLALVALPTAASAAIIGGSYYAPQYDYSEFFAATDGRNFQVILAGTAPFPGVDPNTVASALLPLMQAAKPRPALTFTYDAPVERPRPNYRLVLIFDPANDLGSAAVCNGVKRFKPQTPAGQVDLTRGIREFVVGTGGAGLYLFEHPAANSEVKNNQTFGVLKLTLSTDRYDWKFVPVAGSSFSDSGSGSCH